MQPEDSLFIHSNICGNNDSTNILQEIYPNNAQNSSFSNVSWTNPDPYNYSKNLNTSNNNIFNFQLTDENNVLMDLNGRNWLITIILFTQDKIMEKISLFLDFMSSKYLEQQAAKNKDY